MAMPEMGGRMPFFYNTEGRLIQVDYALQAVSRGSTTLGLKTKDFALVTSQVRPTRSLLEPAEKVFVIDEHVGATGSGYIGDVNTLVDELRIAAQRHRLAYDTPVDVGTLARGLSQYLHTFTMYTVRPFGASIILAGTDDLGIQLVQVDPSGTTFRGSGFAIGQSADEALEVIKQGYRPDLRLEQATALAAQAIESVNGGRSQIEHGVVRRDTRRFKRLRPNGVPSE
ncbi:MAG: proteasome subunit alpha [Euryarchaeota archaeon]|nr:proteasome subunit alpha [Euryarchaeota archaeon]